MLALDLRRTACVRARGPARGNAQRRLIRSRIDQMFLARSRDRPRARSARPRCRASLRASSVARFMPSPDGSTKISIRPPQARPTDQACSSLTPNSSVRTLPIPHRGLRALDDRAFDAAAGDRPHESAVVAHGDLAAGLARRRAPGLDDRAQRNLAAGAEPFARLSRGRRRSSRAQSAPSTARFAITVTRCARYSAEP